jgi:hypothetical protein
VKRIVLLAVGLAIAWTVAAQEKSEPYPKMAPLEEYLMDREAEVALARSAAPTSISADADVLVLGRNGYETAVKGKNGFVCLVERGWAGNKGDSDFWNPKLRGPMCLNAPGGRTHLPGIFKRTQLVLAGKSKVEVFEGLKSAFEKKELPVPEGGAMCYMMSKQGYLGDAAGHWHPHLMFYMPLNARADWGAGLAGSPVLVFPGAEDQVTVFLIPVTTWSDGSAAPAFLQ